MENNDTVITLILNTNTKMPLMTNEISIKWVLQLTSLSWYIIKKQQSIKENNDMIITL